MLGKTKTRKLKGKRIVLAVTGSIAAVESVKLARELIRRGAEVIAVLSKAAQKIIHPYALEFATGNPVITKITGRVEHVELFGDGKADLLLIAPSTANTISKIASGIDDTPITTMATTAIGSKPVIIAPTMHENMIRNPFIVKSIEKLRNAGVKIIEPRYEEGKAKLPDIEIICLYVEREIYPKEMKEKRAIVTSGPTFEHIDPIRFVSNRSSGLMGKEVALELWRRGADVVHITSKPSGLRLPSFTEIYVRSVKDMLKASLEEIERGCDLFVSAAAPADFMPEKVENKIKTSDEFTLKLKAAPKVIWEVRKMYDGHVIGFKAEVGVDEEQLYAIAYEKMLHDKLSMVVANDVIEKGMGTLDTRVLAVTPKRKEWIEGLKAEVAERIVEIYIEDCLCSSLQQA
jgi:phosphopantothenoylcysteine decarboxylase/phosphopantothenate--cysteine ligase